MLKKMLRWLLPLIVLTLIAAYFVIAPALSSHAASAPSPSHSTSTPASGPKPEFYWPAW